MLNAVRNRCPEIYHLAFQAYSAPSPLHFGEHVIPSSSGVQQGDPLRPAFFALAVDGCARSMRAPLNVWYLDDATLAGPAEIVAEDLITLRTELPKLGLELNQSECELTFNIDAATEAKNVYHTISTALPGINITQPECLTLHSARPYTRPDFATPSALPTLPSGVCVLGCVALIDTQLYSSCRSTCPPRGCSICSDLRLPTWSP